MSTVLITGANRGIGLAFARRYAADAWRVFACCRHPEQASELQEIAESSNGQVSIHPLEMTNHTAIEALAATLWQESIDVLEGFLVRVVGSEQEGVAIVVSDADVIVARPRVDDGVFVWSVHGVLSLRVTVYKSVVKMAHSSPRSRSARRRYRCS